MLSVLSTRAPWYFAGPAIGLLIIGLLWVTNKPFGALGGYIELDEWAMQKQRSLTWRTVFILGVMVGGLLSAAPSVGWRPTLAYGSFDGTLGTTLGLKAAVLMGAGMLLGVGGRMAGGCTSGHGLCGTSLGSPASFVCTATFMTTAIACAFVVAWMFGA